VWGFDFDLGVEFDFGGTDFLLVLVVFVDIWWYVLVFL